MAEEMLLLRSGREGWLGSEERSESLSLMRGIAVGGRLGMKSLLQPEGMVRRAAERRAERKKASPCEQEEGRGADWKVSSESRVKAIQSALRKLVKVRRGRGLGG